MLAITFLFFTLQALAFVSQGHQECPTVGPIEHGEVRISENHSFYQVVCHPGYIIHGNPVVYCKDNEWESPTPICVGAHDCEKPTAPENGIVKCDAGPLSAGKACRFECNEGYQLRGASLRRCMINYLWSGQSSNCIPISSTFCLQPPPLKHGTVYGCSSSRLPRVSEKCNFRCNKGYVLIGPTFLTCRSTGKLTDEKGDENFPECVVESLTPLQSRDDIRSERETLQSPSEVSGSFGTVDLGRDPCSNHQCNQICEVENGRAQCRCYEGYTLNQEDQKSCKKKSLYASNPCHVNKGGCEHYCSLTHEGEVFCTCRADFRRGGSDLKSCIKNLPPVQNRDDIRSEKETVQSPHEVRGKYGTADLGYDPCSNHECEQLCRIENGRAQCRCNKGYILNKDDQRTCKKNIKRLIPARQPPPPARQSTPTRQPTPVRQHTPATPVTCRVNNGGCEQHCTVRGTTVRCSCGRGYKLHSDGKHCVDIDECSRETLNPCQHYCANRKGSFTCFCRRGYVLMDGYKCEGCGKNSFWSFELNGCVECPKNSHTDSEGKTSITDCVCNSGFVGNPGDGIICEDINECRFNNFGCSDTCVNIPGSAYCNCPAGFELDNDNKTCIDMDECSIKNGGCEGLCHNLHGSFRCSCLEGYVLSNKDHYSCADVDECRDNNGGCEQICINYQGGYYCACEKGYRLDRSLKNCTGNHIQCPLLPVPPYSNMVCKSFGQKLVEMESYPIATICIFKCNKGFKIANGSEMMECQEDGTWNGALPVCKAQHCDPLSVPENGAIHPSFCSTQGNSVKQRCVFTCNPGYKLEGSPVFQCKNNLTWSHEEFPVCQPLKIRPTIECPRDITTTLLPGKNTHNITLQEPTTNAENYTVHPEWVSTGISIEFPAGVTKVTFTAISPNFNKTAKCSVTVTVFDQEPPVFEYCPNPIKIEGASAYGEFVTWDEPVVTDNVQVESVFTIFEPNTTLTPGTYLVEYVARDNSGNIASCSFDINIIRLNCSDLIDPAHGEANCMDWMSGKFCLPQCELGYMRNPDDPVYYSCDDSGVWEPSDTISECLQFIPATSSTCPEGFELRTNDETSENICLECSSNTVWSATTRKCEETTK